MRISDYWLECTKEAIGAEAPNVYGLLTEEQFQNIAGWFEGAHENYGTAHGYDVIPNHYDSELERLKKELAFIKNHECEWINHGATVYMTGGGDYYYYCKHCSRTKTISN
ncbi:MAG: hypothetical protein K0Q50_201 [Vampirovibrio sp.]|jgi:hypothetical protein|nr:hypothetical protein [Vampirovibrio sp.]